MTLEEKIRKMIVEERRLHQGSNTDVTLGRETILKELERILDSNETDLLLEEFSK